MKQFFVILLLILVPLVHAQESAVNVGTAITDSLSEAKKELDESGKDILVAYLMQENRMIILQSGNILSQDMINALIRKHDQGMKKMTAENQRKERLQQVADELQSDIDLFASITSIDTSQNTSSFSSSTQAPMLSPSLCSLLKDGICDRSCPSLDLDCQCGNGKCESYENKDVCPTDCVPRKNYACMIVRDAVCTPSCPGFDIDCKMISFIDTTVSYYEKHENFYSTFMAILAAMIVILSALSVWLLHKIY